MGGTRGATSCRSRLTSGAISRSLGQKRLFKYRVRISESNAKSLNLTPKPLQAYSCSVTCDTQKSDGVMFVV